MLFSHSQSGHFGPAKMRRLLREEAIIAAPAVYDALGARLVEGAGFKVLAVSGLAVAASYGYPDIGLLTQTEVVEASARIARAVASPIVADGDDGYGSIANVIRTIESFERAGVAAVILEDQTFPKRCAAMAGKTLISSSEMVGKIDAACGSRANSELVIIARTDALGVTDFDDALARAKAYAQAGADMVFLQSVGGADQIERCANAIGVPLMVSCSEGRKSLVLPTLDDYQRLGVKLVVYPMSMIMSSATAMAKNATRIHEERTNVGLLDELMPFDTLNEVAGLGRWRSLEEAAIEDVTRKVSHGPNDH